MGLIKEPKHIDFSTKSEPWSEAELADFRLLMKKLKSQNTKVVKRPTKKLAHKSHV